MDGKRKLKFDAVPSIFSHRKTVPKRKAPKQRNQPATVTEASEPMSATGDHTYHKVRKTGTLLKNEYSSSLLLLAKVLL